VPATAACRVDRRTFRWESLREQFPPHVWRSLHRSPSAACCASLCLDSTISVQAEADQVAAIAVEEEAEQRRLIEERRSLEGKKAQTQQVGNAAP
jgi:hypothetical protein